MQQTDRAGTFSGRVVVLFGTQVFGAAVGVINGILLARLLGPAGKGEYYFIVLLPSTAMVLLQLGLPQAFNFFSARGKTAGIVTKSVVLTAALTSALVLILAALLPLLDGAPLTGIRPEQILFVLVAFPLALWATFTTGIVMGRQAVRWYAGINMAYPVAWTVVLVVVLGGLGASVNGALAAYLIVASIQTGGFAIAAKRVTGAVRAGDGVSYRGLLAYGLPLLPGSLAGFFNYRIDVFLIAFLIANPSEPLGFYSMAVGLAEMVFFFPGAVGTLFFPHVASSSREESDRQVALVSRVTLLVTGAFAILLIPAAALMILLILPAFGPSIVPLLVLLPGVVAFGVARVTSGYLMGIGRPGITSSISLIALAVNIVANLILIPRFGIVGASAASLVSYSLTSLLQTVVAARFTRTRVLDFWVPRVSDVRFAVTTSLGVLRRIWNARRMPSGDRGS